MGGKPRIALVLDEQKQAHDWLKGSFETVEVQRGRHLAADLAASGADLIIMETVHPSEAGWLLSWVRAQPRLAPKPLLMLLPFGPAPRARHGGVAFLEKPVERPQLLARVRSLLQSCAVVETTPQK